MKKAIFYAVNKSGQARVFEHKPRRNVARGVWCGAYDGRLTVAVVQMEQLGFFLPAISWSDEPVEITLSLEYGEG